MSNDLIEPMSFYGNGLCRECGNPVLLKTAEYTVSTLDKNGSPLSSGSMTYNSFYCGFCGHRERAFFDPVSMRFYPENPALKYLIDMKNKQANAIVRHYSDFDLVEN